MQRKERLSNWGVILGVIHLNGHKSLAADSQMYKDDKNKKSANLPAGKPAAKNKRSYSWHPTSPLKRFPGHRW